MSSPIAVPIPTWLPALLGFLIAVGPGATDMYLPAFPAVEASFHSAPGTAQLTLASWFAGLAVGQITQGTVSDRFGRRLPLIVGTAGFTLACVGCALAPSIAWLAGFRAVSAFAASASMVIPRAAVRDLADGHAAGILMSRLMLVMGAAPILAPSIGGLVLLFAQWRVIFVILALYGAIACVLVWRFLPETLGPERRLHLKPGDQFRRYGQILRERGFATHAAMGGFASFGMFAYLGGSSPVFIEGFHLSPSVFALIFGLNSVGLVIGSQINARLLRRYSPSQLLAAAQRVSLGAAAVLCVVAFGRRPRAGAGDGADLRLDQLHGVHHRQRHGGRAVAPRGECRQRRGAAGGGAIQPGRHQRPAGRAAHRRHAARHGIADVRRRARLGDCGTVPARAS